MRAAAGPDGPASSSTLAPTAGAGLGLLVLGLAALFLAGAFGGNSDLPFWILGTGLAILLAALLVTLLQSESSLPDGTTPKAKPAANGAIERNGTSPVGPLSTRRPSPAAVAPTRTAPRVASSIPAQYGSLTVPPEDTGPALDAPDWDDDVSLPFSAGSHFGAWAGPVPSLGGPGASEPARGVLEQEVVRLRERVRELESPPRSPVAPGATSMLTPSSLSSARSLEPPAPSEDGPRRLCTGCGTRLPGGTNDPLCWGCGRPLCSPCYWRTKDGGAAHTCPACFARSFSMGVSGGRGLTPPAARPTDPSMATATGPR